VKCVTYNIQYGVGKDRRTDMRRIAGAVDGADVIALQEVTRHLPLTDGGDQPAELTALLPNYHWVYGPALDLDRSEQADDGSVTNRRMQFGNMLLTRRPILSSRLYMLPKLAATKVQTSQRAALEGVIETGGGPLRIFSVHLSATNRQERKLQVEYLLRLYREGPAGGAVCDGPNNWAERNGLRVPPMPEATMVMGDFNFEPGHPEYTLMTGEIDPVFGRVGSRDVLVDAWVSAGHGEDEGVTCPTCPENNTPHDMRLDYIFVSPHPADRIESTEIDNDAQGSDHQPVWVEIDL
jgi:endonuclease/exonuclease/phosphatase family metal-dependent hydrolase